MWQRVVDLHVCCVQCRVNFPKFSDDICSPTLPPNPGGTDNFVFTTGRLIKLNTHLHSTPYLRINGAIPSLPMTSCVNRQFHFYFYTTTSGVPRNFFGGGGSTNLVEDKGQWERGSGGGRPLVRVSGGSCNLVKEISFRIVKFS